MDSYKHRGGRTRILACLMALACLLALLALSAGCGEGGGEAAEGTHPEQVSPGRTIPLNTLVQGIDSEYGRYDEMPIPADAPPECLVIVDEEEYQLLASMAFPGQPVEEVDFDRYIVIAAMQGPKNTGGYAISITYASQSGTAVRVEVDVVEPDPGSMTAQILTSPYHLVTAERDDFDPGGRLEFTFSDQDYNLLSQQPVEI